MRDASVAEQRPMNSPWAPRTCPEESSACESSSGRRMICRRCVSSTTDAGSAEAEPRRERTRLPRGRREAWPVPASLRAESSREEALRRVCGSIPGRGPPATPPAPPFTPAPFTIPPWLRPNGACRAACISGWRTGTPSSAAHRSRAACSVNGRASTSADGHRRPDAGSRAPLPLSRRGGSALAPAPPPPPPPLPPPPPPPPPPPSPPDRLYPHCPAALLPVSATSCCAAISRIPSAAAAWVWVHTPPAAMAWASACRAAASAGPPAAPVGGVGSSCHRGESAAGPRSWEASGSRSPSQRRRKPSGRRRRYGRGTRAA
eukprot:scaffold11417_cov90-Isochrysis_galbana.AAC.1